MKIFLLYTLTAVKIIKIKQHAIKSHFLTRAYQTQRFSFCGPLTDEIDKKVYMVKRKKATSFLVVVYHEDLQIFEPYCKFLHETLCWLADKEDATIQCHLSWTLALTNSGPYPIGQL